jgi:hypothetical protein
MHGASARANTAALPPKAVRSRNVRRDGPHSRTVQNHEGATTFNSTRTLSGAGGPSCAEPCIQRSAHRRTKRKVREVGSGPLRSAAAPFVNQFTAPVHRNGSRGTERK